MVHNPYQPPASESQDPPAELPHARPRNVTVALGLIGAGIVIQVLAGLRVAQESGFEIGRPLPLVLGAASLALLAVLCWQISQARRWARLVLLILTLISFAQYCWTVGFVMRRFPELAPMLYEPKAAVPRVVPMLLDMIALHLLYFASGSWFRARE